MQVTIETDSDPVKIVQITDCHLETQVGADLLGMDTDYSLQQVLDLITKESPQCELMLATGDISNKGSAEAYQRLQQALKPLNHPNYWIKGNHDLLANMTKVVGHTGELQKIINIGQWQILLIDSTEEGKVNGLIAAEELRFLDASLRSNSSSPTLIFLHHHLVEIGSKWLDEQRVANAAAFFQIVDQYANVKAVVSGHVHQEFTQRRGSYDLYTSPSTCIQFLPFSKDFCLDHKMPGYRWFELYQDGQFKTGVSRVPQQDFHVDFTIKGY